MGKNILVHGYQDIISIENLLQSYSEFLVGKSQRKDVLNFQRDLMGNIFALHRDLIGQTYNHGGYEAFRVNDPKPRQIHKASVGDRLVHHALYRVLYPSFDRDFIYDSYSCRVNKGTHKALLRFEEFGRKVSQNFNKTTWVLKGDIRKCFASIDQEILLVILKRKIKDEKILRLLKNIIESFYVGRVGVGLPLGNLTSQLFVNIYLNELDQYVKNSLKVKYYIRYADDFVIMSRDKKELEKLILKLGDFLIKNLRLELHPEKVFIKTLYSGVDFLGFIHFEKHRVLRAVTRRRMMRVLENKPNKKQIDSYKGLLGWGNCYKLGNFLTKK